MTHTAHSIGYSLEQIDARTEADGFNLLVRVHRDLCCNEEELYQIIVKLLFCRGGV